MFPDHYNIPLDIAQLRSTEGEEWLRGEASKNRRGEERRREEERIGEERSGQDRRR
jgi:hypothetical protein